VHLTLHLTGRCNLRCRYCYDTPHAGGDMTPETMRAAVAFARAGHEGSLGISFFGGEPLLLRELIVETVRHCRRLTEEAGQLFHFKLTTNGLLLDEVFLTGEDTREIFIAVSHDGVREAHDAGRVEPGGAGTFDRLEEKIDLLLQYKPYAPVLLVITPETVRHFADSVEYLYGRGFRYLICTPHFAGGWDETAVRELARQYRRLAAWYEQETLNEAKFYFSPFETKIASHILPGSCRENGCTFGRRQLSVAPNGRLYPCVQFVGDGRGEEYCVGDVWAGLDEEKHRRLYDANDAPKPECAGCAVQERCNHFCGCMNWQATGRIGQVAPVVCAHERAVLPIADKLAARLFKRRTPMFIQKHYNDLYPLLSLLDDAAEKASPEVAP